MSNAQIEPFTSFHLGTRTPIAFRLQQRDERARQILRESSQLLVNPAVAIYFGSPRRCRKGDVDDGVYVVWVEFDERCDVFLQLEGRVDGSQRGRRGRGFQNRRIARSSGDPARVRDGSCSESSH